MFAQTGSPDFFAGLRFIMRPEYSRYFVLFAGLLILLVITAVIAAVVRRSRQAVRTHQSALAFGNLDRLKKKGLLTPEETRKVRMAMARRMMEQGAASQEAPTVETLETEALRAALRAEADHAAEASREARPSPEKSEETDDESR